MAQRAEPKRPALPRRLPRGGPKGQALRGILEGLLEALPPGAALPSERELADRYGLARMTVRNEVERLTAEGLVYRLHGRGTFVAEPRVAQAGAFSSFTEDMVARGHVPGSIVRARETVEADGFLAAALELAPGDPVFRLDRVRTADGRPMAIEQVYLPLPRFEGIEQVEFAQASLFDLLGKRFGVSLQAGQQRVVAVRIEGEDAPLLGVAEGEPGLRFHTVARDGEGVPVYYAVSLYRGDRYEIDLRQIRE
ncbi:MAG: GntR family transcriptional regulator [Thermoleophilaceae bacterium]